MNAADGVFVSENWPAVALELCTTVLILHPFGPDHPNAVSCRLRYQRRGWGVVAEPNQDSARPFLAGQPPKVRRYALAVLNRRRAA